MRQPQWRAGSALSVLVAALVTIVFGLSHPAPAAEFSCLSGDVACLIAAINTANTNGQANTITLEAGTYALTVVNPGGPNGLPVITSTLTIRGEGAEASLIERSPSAQPFRLAQVAATGSLVLDGLTLKGGVGGLVGGGIENFGILTITNSTLSGNSAMGIGGGGIYNEGTVTITNSTLSGNSATPVSGGFPGTTGGGILNAGGPTATVTITNSTLSGNSANSTGGGISNLGSGPSNLPVHVLTITNSTLSGNFAGRGGGISNQGTLTITNSTLSGNSATGLGGGGIDSTGTITFVTLQNTILARNTVTPTGTGPDCRGPVISRDNNLIGDPTDCLITLLPSDLIGDPGLNDFTDDSTPGRGYFPLLSDSPAIDAGNDEVCPETDQLGQPRVGHCDIGAIEFQPPNVDVVAIRRAIFADKLALLFVVATSSAAPDAELFVTVPECLTQVPMPRIADRYILVRAVPRCGDLDAHTATVASSRGGVASAPLR